MKIFFIALLSLFSVLTEANLKFNDLSPKINNFAIFKKVSFKRSIIINDFKAKELYGPEYHYLVFNQRCFIIAEKNQLLAKNFNRFVIGQKEALNLSGREEKFLKKNCRHKFSNKSVTHFFKKLKKFNKVKKNLKTSSSSADLKKFNEVYIKK